MTLPLPPDRDRGIGSEMIVTGKNIDYLRFVAVARLMGGTFKPYDDKIITTFEQHGNATFVKLFNARLRDGPQFIYPDGISFNTDALIIRGREIDKPPSVSFVSLEVYADGADQRLTKITLTHGSPEIVTEELDPSDPDSLSPEDQRVLQAITTSRPPKKS